MLLLILAIFGGLGFAAHVLWFVLIAAVLLWAAGFFIGAGAETGGRRWYGRGSCRRPERATAGAKQALTARQDAETKA